LGKNGEGRIYWGLSETKEGGLEKDVKMVLEKADSLHWGPAGDLGVFLLPEILRYSNI